MAEIPVVFISSTCEDLKKNGYRNAARDAAIGAGFHPAMQEYWAAKDNPPLKECLARVKKADVLVVIVAYRFGWVPKKQGKKDPKKRKSITWLECDEAMEGDKDVLVFVLDESHAWPVELREEYTLLEAGEDSKRLMELATEIPWRKVRLEEFKTWLSKDRVRVTFTTPEDLRGKVEVALLKWRQDKGMSEVTLPKRDDPREYLRLLREETSHIDIRGLQVESGKAQRLPIDKLYIPLKTTLAGEADMPKGKQRSKKEAQLRAQEREPIELHCALKNRKLVILGDPGTGKTTFLRRIAYGLCNSRLGIDAETTAETLGLDKQPFPLLVRVSDLVNHIEGCFGHGNGEPHIKTSPAWLAHFLATSGGDDGTALDKDFFEAVIKDGPAVVLLDGLDETPTREQRECISELVSDAARHFKKCRFVVTSRPPAFEGKAVLTEFEQVRIDPLEDEVIEEFLERWCQALFLESERQARQHFEELLKAFRARVEIRHMARNPVMLTALAVVHWHEKRLPEQRADLYESIIMWLSRARERREGRLPADTCVNRLQELALAMQNHPEGRQVKVPRRWAAEQIAGEWPKEAEQDERKRIQTAEKFLCEEELDSGIIVRRSDDLLFWHLTFQEFLAARAIAARGDQQQKDILLKPVDHPNLYLPEWREAVLLLGGVLHKQGRRKVDNLISAILEAISSKSSLADQAQCVGLLGAMVSDLSALHYQPSDPRYAELLDRVMSIFDASRTMGINIESIISVAEVIGQAGDPRFVEAALGNNWLDIPAGKFLMGAQKEDSSKPNYYAKAWDDESPVHEVSLKGFRIGRYPVTVTEYRRFVNAGGYEEETFWDAGGFGKWEAPGNWAEQLKHGNRPVVGVSWFEAAAYARWRGCRLPTEAEWEYAACGADVRRYPWGGGKPDPSLANYSEGKVGHPTPVGVYPHGATPDGIMDMAGNVWEWCSDWFDEGYYAEAQNESPQGPSSGNSRCLRGGSWTDDVRNLRCSARLSYDPDLRNHGVGFRVVFAQS